MRTFVGRSTTLALIGALAATLALSGGGRVAAASPTDRVPIQVDRSQLAQAMANNRGVPAIDGTVKERSGKRSRSAYVAAYAWPTSAVLRTIKIGEPFQTVMVAAARVASDGSYDLRLDRGSIPRDYISRTGQVDLDIVTWDGVSEGRTSTSVAWANRGGRGHWLEPARRSDATATDPVSLDVVLDAQLVEADAVVGPLAPAPCATILRSTSNVKVQIGDTFPATSMTARMTSVTSHTITVGLGFSGDSDLSPTWSLSGTQSTTSGVSFEWAYSSAKRQYFVEVQYGTYTYGCGGYIDHWNYRPRFPTGGYSTLTTTESPTWSNCATISPGTWTRSSSSGNATSFSTGVKSSGVIGINLSVSTNYASSRTLSYVTTATRRVCGSNNVPALAARVRGST